MTYDQSFIIAPENLDDTETLDVKVTRVFDGDGFLAKVWHPVRQAWVESVSFRLAFIDAPEMDQRFGEEARNVLEWLICGKKLQVVPIVKEFTPDSPLDQYKRLLCMAYLTEEMPVGRKHYYLDGECKDGVAKRARLITRNIELELIINGWAWVVRQYAFDHEEKYFEAQDDAKRMRRGLWAARKPEPPWRFKQRQKRWRDANIGQSSIFD